MKSIFNRYVDAINSSSKKIPDKLATEAYNNGYSPTQISYIAKQCSNKHYYKNLTEHDFIRAVEEALTILKIEIT